MYDLKKLSRNSDPSTNDAVLSVGVNTSEKLSILPNENLIIKFNNYEIRLTKMNFEKSALIYNYKGVSSSEIDELEKCKYLTSSFFYDKNGSAIGYLMIDSEKLSDDKKNDLLNSYIGLSSKEISIQDDPLFPESFNYVFQTGPLIKYKGEYMKINTTNNDMARRVLIAKDTFGSTYEILLIDQKSLFLGPKFSEIRQILEYVEKESSVIFSEVSNLDGGSASVFKNEDVYVREYSKVGGILCFK